MSGISSNFLSSGKPIPNPSETSDKTVNNLITEKNAHYLTITINTQTLGAVEEKMKSLPARIMENANIDAKCIGFDEGEEIEAFESDEDSTELEENKFLINEETEIVNEETAVVKKETEVVKKETEVVKEEVENVINKEEGSLEEMNGGMGKTEIGEAIQARYSTN